MKTLQQVEPRVPVSSLAGSGNYQHEIDAGGSYYLTGNLEVSSGDGILISAPNVVLDLNGFRIHRSEATEGNGGNGIGIFPVADGCVIKNGSIDGFTFGISAIFGSDGSDNRFPRGGQVRGLTVRDCTNRGISVGDNFVISHCTVSGCAYNFFAIEGAVFENCTASNNTEAGGAGFRASHGSSFLNCASLNNVGDGFSAENSATFSGCSADGNGGDGFQVVNGATFTACAATDNEQQGFKSGSAASYSACSAHLNGLDGFFLEVGSTITGCSANGNERAGIYVQRDGNVISGNACSRQTNPDDQGADRVGIWVSGGDNLIIGNNCVLNDFGIKISGTFNLIVRNRSAFNGPLATPGTGNYEIVAGNRYGPIIDLTSGGGDAVSGSEADSSLTPEADHPWANFGM